jgi:hypothetical protein
MMRDELVIEEMSIRANQEKMDDAFRAAMHTAIRTGQEFAPTVVSTTPGTRRPLVVPAVAAGQTVALTR